MRLISAEHLKENVSGIKCGTLSVNYLMHIIDNEEPTVEAIPIEWIKQYGEENWFDFGTQFNAITRMLKVWEERKEEC